jgi:hypothetical protein
LKSCPIRPNGIIPKRCHEQTYLSFVLDGCWREFYGDKARDRTPFTLTIHPAGEIHSERLDSNGARGQTSRTAENGTYI